MLQPQNGIVSILILCDDDGSIWRDRASACGAIHVRRGQQVAGGQVPDCQRLVSRGRNGVLPIGRGVDNLHRATGFELVQYAADLHVPLDN